jgi:hypothetical protein
MRRVLTGAVCLTLAALAVGLILVHFFGDLDTISHVHEVGERIEERIRAAQHRQAAKDRGVEDALAGRLTLLEAAAVHRDLDADLRPGQRDAWRLRAEGDTDDERSCRDVLAHARILTEGRPGGEAAVTPLRRQLEEALTAGDVRLPNPGAPSVP